MSVNLNVKARFVIVALAQGALLGGCASMPARVTPMEYSFDNPHAPGGVLFNSWEDRRALEGALASSTAKSAAVGAAGGAILGQVFGGNTRNTLKGGAVGAVGGLIAGSAQGRRRRVEHENRMTRRANQWQVKRKRELQARRYVEIGAAITEDQKREAIRRLEAARQTGEIEAESARLNATPTSNTRQ
jgi:hypothetical protein